MDDVLDAVDHDRRRHALDVEDALDAEHVAAVDVEQHGEPDAERGPVERPLEGQAEGADVLAVAARLVAVMVRRRAQPERDLAAPVGGVVDVGRQ